MSGGPTRWSRRLDGLLDGWSRVLTRRAGVVAAGSVAVAAVALAVAATNLGVNTDTEGMLSDDLPFRRDHETYKEAFPLNRPGLLAVVDADGAEEAHQAMADLEAELSRATEAVKWTHRPGSGPFFRTHALVYQDETRLRNTADRLDGELGAILGERDPVALLEHAGGLGPGSLRTEVLRAVGATLQEREYTLSWSRALVGVGPDPDDRRLTLQIEPHRDNSRLFPTGPAQERINRIAAEVERAHAPRVSIRLTGPDALEHEELMSVARGGAWAGAAALLLVLLILKLGLGSTTLVAATAVTLVGGLAVTAGFAALAVGRLNMISVAFAVLYIGLGVDYAIHLTLRYRELMDEGLDQIPAVQGAVREIGPALALCALTTSVGFYAFVPTAFRGVAELGLISGTGMFIGLAASLTLLPALLVILPPPRGRRSSDPGSGRTRGCGAPGPGSSERREHPTWADIPFRYGRPIRVGTLLVAATSIVLLFRASFDHNPNNLRDPDSESVSTFQDLLASEGNAPWTLTWIAPGPGEASRRIPALVALASVERVATVRSFVPDDQAERLSQLGRIADRLGALGVGDPTAGEAVLPTRDEVLIGLLPLMDALGDAVLPGVRHVADEAGTADPFLRLVRGLGTRLALADSAGSRRLLERLEAALFSDLEQLRSSADALVAAGPVTVEELPRDLRTRWLGPGDLYRVEIAPAQDLGDREAMESFVADVRSLVPGATGLPVLYLESGRAVVRAFQEAFLSALVVISLLLVLILRKIRDVLHVLLPLVLAGIATGAGAVLMGIPFNFANIIVLPLLFGLGVDNGIHLMHRIRRLAPLRHSVLATSTARGVVFSGLTTLFSFSSLAFTSHRGISSMGQLLVMGVGLILVATLVVLPAFLAREAPRRAPAVRESASPESA